MMRFNKQSKRLRTISIIGCVALSALSPIALAATQVLDQAYITAQKQNESQIVQSYQSEVTQLAAQAHKNAQNVEIQAFIHSLAAGKLSNTTISDPKIPDTEKAESSGQILIFVSSSMSQTSLLQWMTQAKKIGATLVVRGFVNNSLPATKEWLRNLLEQMPDKKGGIAIDPVAFETYGISQVPAVVATTKIIRCLPNANNETPAFDVVYGNVNLREALKAIAEKGESATSIAQAKLFAMRATHEM